MLRIVVSLLIMIAYAATLEPILAFKRHSLPLLVFVWSIPALALAYVGLVKPLRSPGSFSWTHFTAALFLCIFQASAAYLTEIVNSPPSAVGMLGQGPFDAIQVAISLVAAALAVLSFFHRPKP